MKWCGKDGLHELWLTNLCEQSIYKSADVYVPTLQSLLSATSRNIYHNLPPALSP